MTEATLIAGCLLSLTFAGGVAFGVTFVSRRIDEMIDRIEQERRGWRHG